MGSKGSKEPCTLRVHLEANRDDPSETVSISRDHPFTINIQKNPFITEGDVQAAKVIDVLGGFALSIQLDRHGAWLLEQYSALNSGRHFAIFSQFFGPGEKKLNKGRWLASPRINGRIGNGVLTFTPDASREEAEQVALGLNNLAKKLKKNSE